MSRLQAAFSPSRYIGRRGADRLFNAEYLVAAVDREGGGKGGSGGDSENGGAGKSAGREEEEEGVSSCRGGSRNLLAPDALSRGASL